MPSVQSNTNNQSEQLHTSKDSKTASNNQLNANTGGNKTPSEQPEYIKQVTIMIEKKVRNLDKRRQKLEEYQELQKKGEQLNEDQLLAVSKYGEVKTSLELVRDLDKQLIQLGNDTLKQLKKQAKKEQLEREEQLRERLREAEKIKSLLNTFTQENVRSDFLEGRNGASQLTKDELTLLDEFHKLVGTNTRYFKPVENELNESVDHLINLIDSKSKSILTTTYTELKKLVDRISTSPYWTTEPEKPQPPQQQQQQQVEQTQQQTPQPTETIDIEQCKTTYQHNTSTEDYVIVTSQEVENTQVQQQQQQQQQQVQNQDQGPFFTTLNTESVNKFETSEEINFLQDSQIPQQQHEVQYDEHHDQQHIVNAQEQHHQHYNNNNQQGQNYGYAGKRQHYNNDYRNNGNGQPRRSYNNPPSDINNERRSGGVGRGGYQGGRGGPQGGRGGGFQGRGGPGGNYRGNKPRGAPGAFRSNQPESRNDNN